MKTISDKDLGINCDYIATGKNTDEVVKDSTDHIQSEHPDEFDRVKSMLKMNIKDDEMGASDDDMV